MTMKNIKVQTIKEIKAAVAKAAVAKAKAASAGPADVKKTYMTIPYYTPSDNVDIDNLTEEQKKKLIRQGKLMGSGDPITIAKIDNRKNALNAWWDASDFTYDAGTSYKAWTYTWAYLALTIISYVFIHPLLAIPFAWKVGHNWSQYVGGLVFGKEDMKGKTLYHTV